ncbi:MAG: PSD1 and planctomycete cytochrome C domain-containing protein [Xanthomonadaceae bacterium]|nr:PSD1 and planctomycete cytochrome C domain-containing protein [Xanthomonadaceae bacterium]
MSRWLIAVILFPKVSKSWDDGHQLSADSHRPNRRHDEMGRRLWLMLGLLAFVVTPIRAQSPIDFNRDVRPILSDKCFFCHGPDDKHREADLRLDQAPKPGAKSVIVAGKPQDSELIRRILTTDPDEQMPPAKSGKKLSAAEIATLRRWVEQDANWAIHWAYVVPVKHDPPRVADENWPTNWIDRFVLARLEREQLKPARDAARITLLRRLSFDLRGLPPTLDEISSTDYEKLVDQFLASDAFGERMAVWWLDLVRYADTVGYHGDQEHHISPYRDWVIDAFIDNMPFDRFTQAQLAGDLLPESGTDDKIASGYNRLLQTSHEGGVQAKEYLAMYAADRVRNLSGVWLGGTMGCAQCHNHKFDPYTARDFYSLVAFFADLDEAAHLKKGSDQTPTVRAPEMRVLTKRERARAEKMTAEERAAFEKSARLTMISAAIEPREIRILPRGNWLDDSGEVVQPAVPEFLGKLDFGERRATRLDLARWLTDPKSGVGLLTARVMVNRFWMLMFGEGLCRSLEDFGAQGQPPDHPELLDCLAHEFVDSGWNVKHVLRLIAMSRAYRQASPNSEFGGRKSDSLTSSPRSDLRIPPSIHQSRFRLPAEFIRDNALAISGLLVHEVGGPSVRPYQPAGYYKYLNFPKREYVADKDSKQWRRGVYVHWQRQYLHPMFKAFDAPRREECTAQRPRSNTPLAALALLNDPTFVEAAKAFAARILKEGGGSDDSRIAFAFRLATSRSPDEAEQSVLLSLLADARTDYSRDESSAQKLLATGLTPPANDVPNRELAAWMTIARALLNLHEVATRN